MTPQQLVEWRAAIDILALDDHWQQAGTICEAVVNKITEVQAGMAGKQVEKSWLTKALDYIPLLRKKQPETNPTSGMMSPQDFAKSLGALGHKING